MSTTYLLYTEAKINDVWVCVCPYVRYKKNGKEKESMVTTYESGSRSYFGNTYDKLRELNIGIHFPEDLSPELKKHFYDDVLAQADKEKNEYYNPENTIQYYKQVIVCVPLNTMQNALPALSELRYQHCGLFHKDDVYRYETGETEYIEPVKHTKYAKLDEKEKKAYIYYEYDDPMDWPYYFKKIIQLAHQDVGRYIDATANWGEDPEIRIIAFAL